MAYSCWAAVSATYRTLSRSLPKGKCGPCFSRMPNGSRHVPCARPMASRNSPALNSSQCTDNLFWAGDCAHAIEAPRALMETSSVLYTCPPFARESLGRDESATPRLACRYPPRPFVVRVEPTINPNLKGSPMPKFMTIVKGSEQHAPPPPALFE